MLVDARGRELVVGQIVKVALIARWKTIRAKIVEIKKTIAIGEDIETKRQVIILHPEEVIIEED